MGSPKVRNRFSERVAVIAMSADDGRTQEQFKEQVDINNILAKYRKTGVVEHVQRARERYGDFTEIFDVAKNLDKMEKAKQTFEMLPAELRNKFKNSIPGFFDFIKDEKNFDECIRMGIFDKPKGYGDEPSPTPKKTDAGTPASEAPTPAPSKTKEKPA